MSEGSLPTTPMIRKMIIENEIKQLTELIIKLDADVTDPTLEPEFKTKMYKPLKEAWDTFKNLIVVLDSYHLGSS